MRQRKLKWLWARLKEIAAMELIARNCWLACHLYEQIGSLRRWAAAITFAMRASASMISSTQPRDRASSAS
jgi:hypothetical protein